MGCGKSYVGRNLAPLLGFDYVDADKFIEEKEGLSIKEIFEQKGEDYFRNQEKKFLEELDTEQNLVVSTGGGMPCFFNNMDIMNEKGLTIYLNRNKEKTIWRLLKGQFKRPLIAHLNQEELEIFYDERLALRKPFYEKAQLHVGDADVDEIFEMLKHESNLS